MPDIPRDPTALVKSISEYRVESASDLRYLIEMCRQLIMVVCAALECGEYEIRQALTWFDNGNGKRASTVSRPLRVACTLLTLAARRAVTVYRIYQKLFAENAGRKRTDRKFDPEK